MTIDPSKAVGAYAAIVTVVAAWFALGAATPPPAKFKEIDVERINIREPDGTLRMVLSGSKRLGVGFVNGREFPHPNRSEAGIIFLNDEGTENGGLIFDGRMVEGRPTNGGSLTFDRWHQDQTIQLSSTEDGPNRQAGVRINDQRDGPADFEAAADIIRSTTGPARDEALRRANLGGVQRVYLGRTRDAASQLILRDGAGRGRLILKVESNGETSIQYLDASGRIIRQEKAVAGRRRS